MKHVQCSHAVTLAEAEAAVTAAVATVAEAVAPAAALTEDASNYPQYSLFLFDCRNICRLALLINIQLHNNIRQQSGF